MGDNTDSTHRFVPAWSDDVATSATTQDAVMLARILYDSRELKRMAHVLKPYVQNDPTTTE